MKQLMTIITLSAALTGCDGFVPNYGAEGEPCAIGTEKCRGDLSCVEGLCCVLQAYQACGEGGDVYWFDSCEQQGAVAQVCGDCDPCATTADGIPICQVLSTQAARRCGADGHVHWADSCRVLGGIAETCPANGTCEEAGDADAGCVCLGNWDVESGCTTCRNHWVDVGDHCGTCPGNWYPGSDCSACWTHWVDEGNECGTCPGNWDAEQYCASCRNHWVDEGNECGTCPGNWDPAQDCSMCRNHWVSEEFNCDVCPANWDPAQDCAVCRNHWVDAGDSCGTCPGNWDPAQDCAVCRNRWVDAGDDCGTCPTGWDPAQDCAVCAGNWNPASDCSTCLDHWVDEGNDCGTCPGNWDPASACAVCLYQWVDEGNDCGTCPGNWDVAYDCAQCRGNWDPDQDCAVCRHSWLDEGNDCGTCPPHWSPSPDCRTCLGNWDLADDCSTCLNHWVDEGNDCGTCPGNWDASADCDACQGNWDLATECAQCLNSFDPLTDCTACLPGWTGDECDCQIQCEGKECGTDGCGGTCGACTGMGEQCNASGVCEIIWQTELLDTDTKYGGVILARATSISVDPAGRPRIAYLNCSGPVYLEGCNDGSLMQAAWNGTAWDIETVQSGTGLGLFVSLAISEDGVSHIAYRDDSMYPDFKGLRYAENAAGPWSTTTIGQGRYPSLALDALGHPHIAYSQQQTTTNWHLRHAHYDGNQWVDLLVDNEYVAGFFNSIAVDGTGEPGISYLVQNDSNFRTYLKYAHHANSTWSREFVYTSSLSGHIGEFNSLDFDENDSPLIASYQRCYDETNCLQGTGATYGLPVLASVDQGEWGRVALTQDDEQGEYISMDIDDNNTPHLCFFDSGNNRLEYARWTGTDWLIVPVTETGGRHCSIKVDSSGRPHISYLSDIGSGELMYAHL